MTRSRARRTAAVALVAALALGGCATPQTDALRAPAGSPAAAPVQGLPRQARLPDVPFHPQEDYQCGPAALAMALGAIGRARTPESLTAEVYLPARQGTLQAEMLALPRREGLLSIPMPTTIAALLRAVADGGRPRELVLDAYLLRAMAIAGWAPALTECARCATPGPHRAFHIGAGGSVCVHCRPSGSSTPPQAVIDLMSALHDGDWEAAERSTASHRSHASGLVAAHLQWHLERQLRTLPLVERVYRQPTDHVKEMFRQDVPHGDEPGDQLVAGG